MESRKDGENPDPPWSYEEVMRAKDREARKDPTMRQWRSKAEDAAKKLHVAKAQAKARKAAKAARKAKRANR